MSQKWVKLLQYSGLYHRPRPICDIRGRIYNSFAGGIIVQIYICEVELETGYCLVYFTVHVHIVLTWRLYAVLENVQFILKNRYNCPWFFCLFRAGFVVFKFSIHRYQQSWVRTIRFVIFWNMKMLTERMLPESNYTAKDYKI